MGTEITLNEQEMLALANRFKALAEPTRLRILAAICDQERSVQEICKTTGLPQGNVSKHLRLMKEAGVLTCRREGVWRFYRVIDTDLLAFCARHRQSHRSAHSPQAWNNPSIENCHA
jgi:DNA-binding transcriptional ArsR family regulator